MHDFLITLRGRLQAAEKQQRQAYRHLIRRIAEGKTQPGGDMELAVDLMWRLNITADQFEADVERRIAFVGARDKAVAMGHHAPDEEMRAVKMEFALATDAAGDLVFADD